MKNIKPLLLIALALSLTTTLFGCGAHEVADLTANQAESSAAAPADPTPETKPTAKPAAKPESTPAEASAASAATPKPVAPTKTPPTIPASGTNRTTPTTAPVTEPVAVPVTEAVAAPTAAPIASGEGVAAESAGTEQSAEQSNETREEERNEAPAEQEIPDKKEEAAPGGSAVTGNLATAAEIVDATNTQRKNADKAELSTLSELQSAADLRATELAIKFSHTRPDGTACFTAFPAGYTHMGENIAMASGRVDADALLTMWMNSSGHRANILSDNYNGMAAGIYYDAAGNATYGVQLFAEQEAPKPQAPAPTYTYTDTVVAPTCTEGGYTLHTCNEDAAKSYKDAYTDKLAHTWDDGEVTTVATAGATGIKTYTCTACSETKTEEIPALGYTYTDTVIAPTCTERGYTLHTCNEDAAKSYKDAYTEKLAHSWDDGEVTTAATAGATGIKTYTCTACSETKAEKIPALGYTYTDTVVAPTCTERGYTLHTCNEDAAKSYKDAYTEKLAHSWDEGKIATEPTVNAAGVKTFTCANCGDTYTESITHLEKTYTDTVVAPTCTEAGYTSHKCNETGETTKSDEIPATGHNYVNGVCENCNEKDPDYKEPAAPEDFSARNAEIASLTNAARAENGLAPLSYCSEFQSMADTRAVEITNTWGHTRPDGSPFYSVFGDATLYSMGENIQGGCSSPDLTVSAWMNSAGHRANILGTDYDGIVVGTAKDSYGSLYSVQLFVRKRFNIRSEVVSTTVHEPTCTEDGYTEIIYEDTSGERTDIVKATGHNFVNGVCTKCNEKEVVKTYGVTIVTPPSCEYQGFSQHVCNETQEVEFFDYVPATGHQWDDGVITTEPTETDAGVKTFTCTECGKTKTEAIDKITYTYTDTVIEPTCTEKGYTEHKCNETGETTRIDEVPATGHTFISGVCDCGAEDTSNDITFSNNYSKSYFNNTIIDDTNSARTSRGGAALNYASEYQAQADVRAMELAESYSHTRPNGKDGPSVLEDAGADLNNGCGENIARMSYAYKPSHFVEMWLNSAGHFTNMMNANWDSFVVGTWYDDATQQYFAVQIFFKSAVNEVPLAALSLEEVVPETVEIPSEDFALETIVATEQPDVVDEVPVTEDSETEDSETEDSVAEAPVTEAPVAESPVVEEPVAEVAEEQIPVSDETPTDETPTDETPADEHPAEEVTTEPEVEELVVEEESVEETPTAEDSETASPIAEVAEEQSEEAQELTT